MNTAQSTATSIRLSHQALLYAQLGAVDSAFSRLTLAVRAKDPTLYAVVNAPGFAPLQRDPRWAALMQEYRGRK